MEVESGDNMDKMKKFIMLLCFGLVLMTVPVIAAETVAEGQCGAKGGSVFWRLDGDGVMTFSGTGSIENYDRYYNYYNTEMDYGLTWPVFSPWHELNDAVTKIVIEEGVTGIGDSAFSGFENLKSATIAESVTKIGRGAFSDCSALESLTVPDAVTYIGYYAFSGCRGLVSIGFPTGTREIKEGVFLDCRSLTDVHYNGSPADWSEIAVWSMSNTPLYNAAIHCVYPDPVISLTVGGEGTDIAPLWRKGIIVVPLVPTLTLLGAEIEEDETSVTVRINGKTAVFSKVRRSAEAVIDDLVRRMETIPETIDGDIYVSLGFLARELGYRVRQTEDSVDISIGIRLTIDSYSASQIPEDFNGPENLFDGDRSTRWACNGPGSVTVDLGGIKELGQVNLFVWNYSDGRSLSFTVEISADGEDWTPVGTETYGWNNGYSGTIELDAQARYVRVGCNGSSISDWASIADIEIYSK